LATTGVHSAGKCHAGWQMAFFAVGFVEKSIDLESVIK
jgi:hypothetical protein